MKCLYVYPPGLSKPVRVTQGKGEHTDLGTISKAVYILMCKGADVKHTFIYCEQCDAYHVGEGMELTEDAKRELKGQSQKSVQSTQSKKVSFTMRL